MGNVYRQDSKQLHELLDKASATHGATLLIPDLQRPYVWTPNQVTLLIDSLIRGWPFGTLLLWRVSHQELHGIPFRPFWTVVDRVNDSNGAQVSQMNPPAEYHMVLDGQQRVQSMLLALGGDDWGFQLEDRDWTEEVKERRPRGRQAKYKHWSKASLCFDLRAFIDEYERQGKSLLAVDFRQVLKWAVTDPQSGQSDFPKPDNYEEPLPKAYAVENRNKLIRLSRLWKEAQPNPALKEANFRQILRPLLSQHGVAADDIEKLLNPMGELMTTLRDVKLADVTFLELQPYDPQTWSRDSYNDAIVNIFTRLNTAGRTLTSEEITLAWLKVGWEKQFTDGKLAGQCFTELRETLADLNLALELDDLVMAASFVWSVCDNSGKLLVKSDLLKGGLIRPMAAALARRWIGIQNAFSYGAGSLSQRGLEYGPRGHFFSVYALAVLWTWLYIGELWKSERGLKELERDDFEKRCSGSIASHVDRWIICSQWAGVWSGSSATKVEAYAAKLTELLKTMIACSDSKEAHRIWDECFRKFVDDLGADAANQVNGIAAQGRERVTIYRNFLWIWHRLENERWEKSQVQLRVGKSKATTEVDHIMSFALWQGKLHTALPKQMSDEVEAVALANRLGNCALLEKNFNISKSDKPLKSFLSQIHEIREKKIRMDAWCAALDIPNALLEPDVASVDEIAQAIESRDGEIRADLTDFVRGTKVRVDVVTPALGMPQPESSFAAPEESFAESIDIDEEESGEDTDAVNGSDGQQAVAEVDLDGLRAAYDEDDSVRLIIHHFAERERNQRETHVERLAALLNKDGSKLSRSGIIRAFRRLDALGVGRFIPGRKGHPTRFAWRVKSLSVRGLVATGNASVEQEAK